jgi:hypothetical protein
MGFGVTTIFYLVIGAGVAAATVLAEEGRSPAPRGFRAATALVFWPLFLPILLARPRPEPGSSEPGADEPRDELTEAIARVEAELDAAFSSLDGWAEDVLAHEAGRLRELRTALTAQAARIREMDRLLAGSESEAAGTIAAIPAPAAESGDRRSQSEQARRANFERLRRVRRHAYDDLMATLAWVRELVSMIHLAKFTGAPASRAGELVAQIAAAVEGVSAVTWQGTPSRPFGDEGQSISLQPSEEDLRCDCSAASAT